MAYRFLNKKLANLFDRFIIHVMKNNHNSYVLGFFLPSEPDRTIQWIKLIFVIQFMILQRDFEGQTPSKYYTVPHVKGLPLWLSW